MVVSGSGGCPDVFRRTVLGHEAVRVADLQIVGLDLIRAATSLTQGGCPQGWLPSEG